MDTGRNARGLALVGHTRGLGDERSFEFGHSPVARVLLQTAAVACGRAIRKQAHERIKPARIGTHCVEDPRRPLFRQHASRRVVATGRKQNAQRFKQVWCTKPRRVVVVL